MRLSGEMLETIRLKAALWLRQGVSPGRLALTIALGFVIGCIPLIGLPTALCALVALAFRLNQPAIQAANYAAMPFQIVLILPLVRLGGKLMPITVHPVLNTSALGHLPAPFTAHSAAFAMQMGGMATQALIAWLLLAIPVVLLLTPTLTLVFRRVPALARAKSTDLI